MKLKTLTTSLISSAVFLSVVSVVSAQSPTPSATPTTKRGYMMQAKEVRQELREATKAARQAERLVKKAESIAAMAARIEARFDRHEERLNNWIERAQKHIDKKEAEGTDMTNAQTALDATKTELANAVVLGNEAVALIQALTAESWSQQSGEVVAARTAVKEAHLAFVKTVQNFRLAVQALKAESE
jgi:hypothetical protein